ncbi:hypothetical protein CA831_22900, partial [Burkholderia multivorans]
MGGNTYSFAGGTPAGGDVVSVGSAAAPRQIQNVAAGQISAASTDAINGSQLYATNLAINSLSTSTLSGITSLSTGLSSTNSNVASLSTGLSSTNSNVASLSTGLSSTNSSVASLSTGLSSTDSNVASLSTGLSS